MYLEQYGVVWHSSLTKENSDDLEWLQKSAVKVILNNQYKDNESALERLEIQKLKNRRELLCKNFANKCNKNGRFPELFKKNTKQHSMNTRKS